MWTFGRLDTTIAQQLVDLFINDGLHSGVLRVEPFYGLFVSHDDVVLRDTGYPFEVVKSTQLNSRKSLTRGSSVPALLPESFVVLTVARTPSGACTAEWWSEAYMQGV